MFRSLILCLAVMSGATTVGAQIPNPVSYQGRLTNPDGSTVSDGNHQIAFAVYDHAVSGNLLWSCPAQSVPVEDGLFTHQLGSVIPLPTDLFSGDTLRWLAIEVNGEQLLPRTRFSSVPYAYRSLYADTATYAISGGGGWNDNASTVVLTTPSDSVGIGSPTPQGKLDVSGDMIARREDRPGDLIRMNVSSGPVGLHLRSGTTQGTPLIDFANDDTTDFDARLVLLADSSMWWYGKPYVDLKLDGNLRVERIQTDPMVFGQEVDGIKSFYTYKGTSSDPYSYQGAAMHAISLVGGDGTSPVGTVTGLASQAAMVSSGDPFNELTPLFLSCNSLEPARLWGVDLSVHGPITAQSNLIQGIVNFVNNYNPDPVTFGSFGLSVVSKPGRGGAATDQQRTARTYPLDVGLGISGRSGDASNQTEAYKVALQVGGSCSGWMNPGERSILRTGIQVSDVFEAGARFTNFLLDTAPALSFDVPYVMQIKEDDNARWELRRDGVGDAAALLLEDSGETDKWWWGAFAAGSKKLSFQNDAMVVNRDGNVGIGASSPTNILTVEQNSLTDPVADAWTVYSSQRWKTNIRRIKGAVAKVNRLRGVTYNWREDGRPDIGLIAEEVGQVVPEVVEYETNGVDARSVDYARLVALLIESTNEQQETIELLEARIAKLEIIVNATATARAGGPMLSPDEMLSLPRPEKCHSTDTISTVLRLWNSSAMAGPTKIPD